jgi:hypothetical protein
MVSMLSAVKKAVTQFLCSFVSARFGRVRKKLRKTNTGLFEMNVGVLTTCHTQYTSFSRCNPM